MAQMQCAGDIGRRHANDERRPLGVLGRAPGLEVAARLPPLVDALLGGVRIIGFGDLVEAAWRCLSLGSCHRAGTSWSQKKPSRQGRGKALVVPPCFAASAEIVPNLAITPRSPHCIGGGRLNCALTGASRAALRR